MDIRLAEPGDLAACQAITTTIQSTHVWQLRLAFDPSIVQPIEVLGGTLYRTRLPRPVVIGPASVEPLDVLWSHAADAIVAEDQQGIAGYLLLSYADTVPAVSIARLVVNPLARRAGTGGLLLGAAIQWTRGVGLHLLTAHCAARNDPAASFFLRYGFRFAGYSEALYPRGEVALLWQRAV